jgi:rRNA maturation protein Nop10
MIQQCTSCGSYGLDESCRCGGTRASPKPPKYNPNNKHVKYRVQYKQEHDLL